MLLFIAIAFIFIGILSGISSGLIGFGGGFFVVPVMYWGLQLLGIPHAFLMHIAIGTSLTIMIFTAANSSFQHHRKGSINWRVFLILLPALIIGSLVATVLASKLHSDSLRFLFIAYLFITIVYSYFKKTFSHTQTTTTIKLPNPALTQSFGFLVGFLATLLGVGGSVITVPFFRRRNLAMKHAAGMAVILTLPIAIVGTLGYLLSGLSANLSLPHCIGYIYWPAVIGVIAGSLIGVPIGTKLAYKIPDSSLAKSYLYTLAAVMVIMCI